MEWMARRNPIGQAIEVTPATGTNTTPLGVIEAGVVGTVVPAIRVEIVTWGVGLATAESGGSREEENDIADGDVEEHMGFSVRMLRGASELELQEEGSVADGEI